MRRYRAARPAPLVGSANATIAAARRRAVLAAAAGDDDVLPAVDHVDRRRRVARGRQRRLPQQLAGQLVVGAELLVEVRRADEQQAARRSRPGRRSCRCRCCVSPFAASSGYSPNGIFQRIVPAFRSIAFSVPHGGVIGG